jgi:hypothetical protein
MFAPRLEGTSPPGWEVKIRAVMANPCVVAEGVSVEFLAPTARERGGKRVCLSLAH